MTVKERLHELVDSLPDNITFEDLEYQSMKEDLEQSENDIKEGNIIPHKKLMEDLKNKYKE